MGERTYTAEEVAQFEEFMRDPGRRAAFATTKRRYDRVFQAVFSLPWAIVESYMEVVATVLVEHISGALPTSQEVRERIEAAPRRSDPVPSQPGVVVIPIHGVITPRAGMLDETSGMASVERIRAQFRDAMASPQVSAVVFDIDSPGGSIAQVPEFASEIRAARGRKPITAAISGLGASAAYWLASQASEVVITPSGLTGSIGVVQAHQDLSVAAEKAGVKVTLIHAGKHKVDGNPSEPLSEDARAHVQSMVDEFYGMFTSDIAKGREVPIARVREGMGEGRVVNARAALAENMVDRIATVEDVVGEFLSARPQAAAAVGEMREDVRDAVAIVQSALAASVEPGQVVVLEADEVITNVVAGPEDKDHDHEEAAEVEVDPTDAVQAELDLLRAR